MSIYADMFSVVVLGLIGGSVPGPILTSVFTEVLRIGFRKSLFVVLKGLFAEILVGSIVLVLMSLINPPQVMFYSISFAGALYIFYLAFKIGRIRELRSDEKVFFTFSKIFFLTLLNGPFWIFWVTICVPMAFEFKQYVSWGPILFLICFEVGWLISTTVWAFVFSRFRPLLTKPKFLPTVFMILAILLFSIGVRMLIGGIRYFI